MDAVALLGVTNEQEPMLRYILMSMQINKALTFRASSIGDCLMGKYLLENIHAQFPQARLGIVVASRAWMIRDLFAAYPWLEVIEANRRSPLRLFSLLKNFYRSDLVVTQYAGKPGGRFGLASKLFARILAKHPTSLKLRRGTGGLVGFTDASWWSGALYDKLVPMRSGTAPAELEREALLAAGIPIAYQHPTMRCMPIPNVTEKFGLGASRYIVVHLFAGNTGRGLSPDKKHKLLVALAEKLPGIRLVVSGGVTDREEALAAAHELPATVIAGEATLQELTDLIMKSHGVVSVDTGVAHMTAQLGKPLIVLATCLGLHWWKEGQYDRQAPIRIFTRTEANGHSYNKYPDCINHIDIREVARSAMGLCDMVVSS